MYHTAHSLPETFGGDVTATRQKDVLGVEYNNSLSARTVHDSSPYHPWFAKTLAAQHATLAADGLSPHLSDVSELSEYSDFEELDEGLQINPIPPSMQPPIDDGKPLPYEGKYPRSRSVSSYCTNLSQGPIDDSPEDAAIDPLIHAMVQPDLGQQDGGGM